MLTVVVCGAAVLSFAACDDDTKYDISPIFPLSSDKCEKYGGEAEGEGLSAHCYVSKDDCERAASDWRNAMQRSGVTDAIQFSCN